MAYVASREPVLRAPRAAHSHAGSAGAVTRLPCVPECRRPIRPTAPQGWKRLPRDGGSCDLRCCAIVGRTNPAGKGGPGEEHEGQEQYAADW